MSSTDSHVRYGTLLVGATVTFHLDESVDEIKGWAEAVVEKDLDRALRDAGVHDVGIGAVHARFEESW